MKKKSKLPKVAIVGRINVGKSTLFNRLIEEEKAIVSQVAGTTRDRNYSACSWGGKDFILVDTGGVTEFQATDMEKKIQEHTEKAIEEADLILFVLDIQQGVIREDTYINNVLRKTTKPVILVLNKADNPNLRKLASDSEFLKLGLDRSFQISAISGSGTGDLLDEIVRRIPPFAKASSFAKASDDKSGGRPANSKKSEEKPSPVKLAIIGRPNVGKSSFFNAILGEERVIVSDLPYTTREPQDTLIQYKKNDLLLIDTAGIRKKTKIKSSLEQKSLNSSLRTISKSDVILFIIEAPTPIGHQDKHLAKYITDSGRAAVLTVNKWDLIEEKSPNAPQQFDAYLRRRFPFLKWAPIIYISAKTGQRVRKVLDLALEAKKQWEKRLASEELYDFIQKVPKVPNRRILSFAQTAVKPPQFLLKVKRGKERFPAYYSHVIEKKLREKFGFIGTPITVIVQEVKL